MHNHSKFDINKIPKIIRFLIVGIVLVLIFCAYLYFDTSTFFEKVDSKKIKIYMSIPTAGNSTVETNIESISVTGFYEKYPIDSLKIAIKNPFEIAIGNVDINFKNFKKEINFWYDVPSYLPLQAFNKTAQADYIRNNSPDFVIVSPLFEDGMLFIWVQDWRNQPIHEGPLMPFLVRTAYDTWEGEYYWDYEFDASKYFKDIKFIPSQTTNSITFEIAVPKKYRIENSIDYTSNSENYIVSKTLNPGETIHLTAVDVNRNRFKQVLVPLLLVLIIPFLYPEIKQRFIKQDDNEPYSPANKSKPL